MKKKKLKQMVMLSLFSGIGGIDIAAERAGIKTIAFCEKDPFCQKVLHQHWPEVPIISDVRQITKELLENEGLPEKSISSQADSPANHLVQPTPIVGNVRRTKLVS